LRHNRVLFRSWAYGTFGLFKKTGLVVIRTERELASFSLYLAKFLDLEPLIVRGIRQFSEELHVLFVGAVFEFLKVVIFLLSARIAKPAHETLLVVPPQLRATVLFSGVLLDHGMCAFAQFLFYFLGGGGLNALEELLSLLVDHQVYQELKVKNLYPQEYCIEY